MYVTFYISLLIRFLGGKNNTPDNANLASCLLLFPRLRNAWQCPGNGSHFEECDCEDEDYQQSGASYYSKIRIDLSAMKIIRK